jgi:hypothetical protein
MITTQHIEEMYQPSIEWLKSQGFRENNDSTRNIPYWYKSTMDEYQCFVFDRGETTIVYNYIDYATSESFLKNTVSRIIFTNSADCLENVKFYSL